MICAALAWNLKAWYGLMVPDKATGWSAMADENGIQTLSAELHFHPLPTHLPEAAA
jgi:hypothetical protein